MIDAEDKIALAMEFATIHMGQVPESVPQCVLPALKSAVVMWHLQGDIPPAVCIDYDRGLVPVPDDIDGRDVLPFMHYHFVKSNAKSVHYVYESSSDKLVVIFLTDSVLYKLTAEAITKGDRRDVGAWTLETHLPRKPSSSSR